MKKNVVTQFLMGALLASSLAAPALYAPELYAQAPDPAVPAPGQHRPDPARLEELKAKIETLKYEKIKQAIALDGETAPKFFDIYKPAEKEIQAIAQQRNEELKKLGLMMNGAKSDGDVDPQMQKIRDLNKQIEDRQIKLDADLKPVLSSRQRAKLLVFEQVFNRRIRDEVVKRRLLNEPQRELRQKVREMRVKRWLKNHQQTTPKPAPGKVKR